MPRDYRAEEQRRNEIYRALGFTSRAQARRARRLGTLPSAAAVRQSPEARADIERRRAETAERQRRLEREGPTGIGGSLKLTASDRDFLSRRWSGLHSRQDSSRWAEGWSRNRKDQYYYAFVDGFTLAHDERDFAPLNEYYDEYVPYDPDVEDRSPYPRD